MEITALFPPGACIRNLPSLENPRLYIMGLTPTRRWQESALYPAYRRSAKMYRFLLRIKAMIGLCAIVSNRAQHWPVKEFVETVCPDMCSTVVLAGTPGPTQKLILQLWDDRKVVGYLKYAEKPAALVRLEKEQRMLSAMPKGLGPTVLKYGCIGNGMGLLLAPVLGKPLSISLPPPSGVDNFLTAFCASPPIKIDSHPWIILQREQHGSLIDQWIEALSQRKWPIVFSHGDFVPWNILSTKGHFQAIDWEYGTLEGFPYLDLAYYILQLGRLLYRWSPQFAFDYARHYLMHGSGVGLKKFEAQSLVRLAAFHALQQTLEDGKKVDEPLQTWWKAAWEESGEMS